jgi:hypothetical protein
MAATDAAKDGDFLAVVCTGVRRHSYDDRLVLLQDEIGSSSLAAFLKSIPCADIHLTQFENPAYV